MKIPISRKEIPKLMVEDLLYVQPMKSHILTDMTGSAYESESVFVFGEAVHRFVEGWGVAVSPNEVIDFHDFIDRYGVEYIVPRTLRPRMSQWYFNDRMGIK